MASKEVFVDNSGLRLFGGLEWRLLDASQQGDAVLRAAANERGATHAVTVKSADVEEIQVGKKVKKIQRTSGGFFSSSNDQGPGKKGHSLAAAFARWSREHPKAALCLTMPAGGFCVVVVFNGLPVLDRYVPIAEEAFSLMNGYTSDNDDMSVFADDQVRFPTALMNEGLLQAVIDACDKTTLIKAIPPDLVKIAIAFLVIAAIAGGYFYYEKHKKIAARKAAMLKAAEENPVPKYLAGLAAQRASLGFDRASLINAYQFAKPLLVDPEGWHAKRITCGRTEGASEGCMATYERKYGTYQDITQALPKLTLANAPKSLDLNLAQMSWKQELKPQPVGEDAEELDAFIRGMSGSQMQNWLVAGLALQVQPAVLWPAVIGVPPSFRHPKALAIGRFSVTGVSLPLFEEAIKTAPANVIWSGWQIDVGDIKKGGNPLDSAKVTLTGNYYVKN